MAKFLSVTKENLLKIKERFPCFQEGMFDSFNIRRKGNSWYVDRRADKLVQDLSLFALLFLKHEGAQDTDTGISQQALDIIALFKEERARHIYLSVETELDAIPSRKVWICGEFPNGTVYFDFYGKDHFGSHDYFVAENGATYTSLLYTDGLHASRRMALARFCQKDYR